MAENNSSAPLKTAEGAAPPNNLPSWEECQLRVSNSEFIANRIAEGGYGAEHDSKLATELHRFIHEYDDADSYRSAWFRHRLEMLLHEVAAQAVAAQAAPAAVAVPALDQYLCQAWGETDLPAVAIVDGLDAVKQFLIDHWLGSADHQADDGTNMLEEAMAGMQEEWELEGKAWKWEAQFEIGGVSIQRVDNFTPALVAPAAPSAYLNAAGVTASDKPITVVRKLDAAFHDAVTFKDATPALPATEDSSAGDLAEVQAEPVANPTVNAIAAAVCQRVAELDDRSSPADWPEAMLVTAEELQAILIEELAAALPAPQAQPADALDAERALRKVLHAVQRYLPPDGITIDTAMNEIITAIDPWPIGRAKEQA